jgi:exodeoxyribonuclease X
MRVRPPLAGVPGAVVIDTETTGMEDQDQVIEVAAVWEDGHRHYLVRPTVPVHPAARAAHHITDRTLSTCAPAPSWRANTEALVTMGTPVFHNADFDMKVMAQTWPGLATPPHICTYRVSLRLWPDAPSHSNQALRYWLEEEPAWLPPNLPPHRALPDACVTTALLHRMVREVAPDDTAAALTTMAQWTLEPVVLHRVRFGKHQGLLWSQVPRDYLRWVLRQPDFDRDVMHTAHHFIGAPPALAAPPGGTQEGAVVVFSYRPQPDEKGAEGCVEHSGQHVTIARVLHHGMALIRAADGWEGNAFLHELRAPA